MKFVVIFHITGPSTNRCQRWYKSNTTSWKWWKLLCGAAQLSQCHERRSGQIQWSQICRQKWPRLVECQGRLLQCSVRKILLTTVTSCSLLVSPLLWNHLICCSKTSIYRRYYSATGQRVRWEFQRRASLTTECQGIFVVISFTASCRFHQWCVS